MGFDERAAAVGMPLSQVMRIPPYPPGRPIESVAREFGIEPGAIIKLASNENPNGCSPAVAAAVAAGGSRVNLYPDFYCYELQHAIARQVGVAAEQVLPAAGSSELIVMIARAYLDATSAAVLPRYSFHSYHSAVQSVGGESVVVGVRDWLPDFDALLDAVTPRTRLLYLASPNNPTGATAAVTDIERFAEELPEHVVLVLDEAYHDYLPASARPDPLRLLSRRRALLIMRTFSKIHGLAGLRVGYGLADEQLLQALRRLQSPFSVSSVAQVAAVAALSDVQFTDASRQLNATERERLTRELDARGIECLRSAANFVLARVGDGEQVARALMRQGVIVRAVGNYALEEWIRVTIGLPYQNDLFLSKLDGVLRGMRPEGSPS
jgi:histidinol-phosphate aminotransferase